MQKRHRDQKDIPTSEEEQREWVKWILDHKVWTHPITIKLPPEGRDFGELFEGVPGTPFTRLLDAPDDWEEAVSQDGSFYDCADVEYVFVNPDTDAIDDNEALNTAFRVWIEAGPWHDLSTDEHWPIPEGGWTDHNRWGHSHDIRLDCGADSAHAALLTLAALVGLCYDEEGVSKDVWPCLWASEEDKTCEPAEDGFCRACGFSIEPDEESEEHTEA